MTDPASAATTRRATPRELFVTYLLVALGGSGGLFYWTYRLIVERRRWLTPTEFAEYYGLGQIVPGANLYNTALMLGHRFAGVKGMLAAVAGFVGLSFFVMVGAGVFYEHYGSHPLVARALRGMGAVAVGLLLAAGCKLALAMPRTWRPWAFIVTGFVGVGLLRLPLLWIAVPLAGLSVYLAWREDPAERRA